MPSSAVDSPAALMPQRAVCHGGEEHLAARCEMSVFSQDTHCLSAAPASTLLAHSAVADMSLIKEEEQFEISFSFLNRISCFHQSLQGLTFVLEFCCGAFSLWSVCTKIRKK